MFADDVDGTFLGIYKVAQSVLGVGKAAREANGEDRWVVGYDVGVGEGSEVCGLACGMRQARNESER